MAAARNGSKRSAPLTTDAPKIIPLTYRASKADESIRARKEQVFATVGKEGERLCCAEIHQSALSLRGGVVNLEVERRHTLCTQFVELVVLYLGNVLRHLRQLFRTEVLN